MPTVHDTLCPDDLPCRHNAWENVRVVKKKATLRCRVCQKQFRTSTDVAWRTRKCKQFTSASGCPAGAMCAQLHVYPKKQTLPERVQQHGEKVLKLVPVAAIPSSLLASQQKETPCGGSSCGSSVGHEDNNAPCSHNSWDNVRVKKRSVALRCRKCECMWHLPLGSVPKCPAFPGCRDTNCSKLHVHLAKLSIVERVGIHGRDKLNNVPQRVIDDAFKRHRTSRTRAVPKSPQPQPPTHNSDDRVPLTVVAPRHRSNSVLAVALSSDDLVPLTVVPRYRSNSVPAVPSENMC